MKLLEMEDEQLKYKKMNEDNKRMNENNKNI